MNRTIYVRNPEQWQRASEAAARDGLSMSELLDRLLARYLKEEMQRRARRLAGV